MRDNYYLDEELFDKLCKDIIRINISKKDGGKLPCRKQ